MQSLGRVGRSEELSDFKSDTVTYVTNQFVRCLLC